MIVLYCDCADTSYIRNCHLRLFYTVIVRTRVISETVIYDCSILWLCGHELYQTLSYTIVLYCDCMIVLSCYLGTAVLFVRSLSSSLSFSLSLSLTHTLSVTLTHSSSLFHRLFVSIIFSLFFSLSVSHAFSRTFSRPLCLGIYFISSFLNFSLSGSTTLDNSALNSIYSFARSLFPSHFRPS